MASLPPVHGVWSVLDSLGSHLARKEGRTVLQASRDYYSVPVWKHLNSLFQFGSVLTVTRNAKHTGRSRSSTLSLYPVCAQGQQRFNLDPRDDLDAVSRYLRMINLSLCGCALPYLRRGNLES